MSRAEYIMLAQILYRNKPVKKGPQMSLWRKIRDNFVESLSASSFKYNKVKFIEYTETGYMFRRQHFYDHPVCVNTLDACVKKGMVK